MTATSSYLNRRPRALEEVITGRRVIVTGAAALGLDPGVGKIIAAVPGKVLVRFPGSSPGTARSEWRRLEQLEILS